MGQRDRLLKRIGDINDFDRPRSLVTLEEFFDGNEDFGSIGYNFYPDQPAPSEFYSLFRTIRDRVEVADVRVQVKDLEDPEGWPSSDTIWIITSASEKDVRDWLGERFAPDDVRNGFPVPGSMPGLVGYEVEQYDVPDGHQAIGVWWD